MNVCVIGGSGFIGSHLINSIATHHNVTNVDKQLPEYNNVNVANVIADIRDYDALKLAIPDNSDYIILLAAEHRDDVSPISLYYDVNVEGTHNVLRVMAEKNIEHIIFTSSVSVYGLNKKDPDELSGTDRESGRWGFPLPSQPLVSGLAYCLNKAHPTTAEPASATAFA